MLHQSIEEFEAMEAFDELFFVAHTTDKGIQNFTTEDHRIHVMVLDRIADLVINVGLMRWQGTVLVFFPSAKTNSL